LDTISTLIKTLSYSCHGQIATNRENILVWLAFTLVAFKPSAPD